VTTPEKVKLILWLMKRLADPLRIHKTVTFSCQALLENPGTRRIQPEANKLNNSKETANHYPTRLASIVWIPKKLPRPVFCVIITFSAHETVAHRKPPESDEIQKQSIGNVRLHRRIFPSAVHLSLSSYCHPFMDSFLPEFPSIKLEEGLLPGKLALVTTDCPTEMAAVAFSIEVFRSQ
jgi:hypothetical protein